MDQGCGIVIGFMDWPLEYFTIAGGIGCSTLTGW